MTSSVRVNANFCFLRFSFYSVYINATIQTNNRIKPHTCRCFLCEGGLRSCSDRGWGLSCSHCWSSCQSLPSCSMSDRTLFPLSSPTTSSCSAPRLQERDTERSCIEKSHVARLQHSLTGHHHRPVLSRTIVSAGGLNTLLPLLLHLLRWGVVDVSFALSKQLLCKLHYSGKVVTGVSELVWTDLEHGNIFQDHLKSSTAKKCEHKTYTSWFFLLLYLFIQVTTK